jgi:hypothetical protein
VSHPSEDQTDCLCGLGYGNFWLGIGVVPGTTGIRLQTAAGTPSFDSEGQVQGRLEVFHDGQWGTVCDDGFGWADAQVACRQLGNELGYTLTSSSVVSSSSTDDGSDPIWLDDLGCSGSETSLGNCRHAGWCSATNWAVWCGPENWGTEYCGHYEDIGVSCTFLAPGDECEECVAGKFSSTSGVVVCTSCAAGSYSTVGATSCQQVRWGGGEASAKTTCHSPSTSSQCEAGKASAAPGAAACEECAAGKFTDTAGGTACVRCAAGSYSTVVGSVSAGDCQLCEAGKASATRGATACEECEAGKFSNAAGVACTNCPDGTFSTITGMSSEKSCQQVSGERASESEAQNIKSCN